MTVSSAMGYYTQNLGLTLRDKAEAFLPSLHPVSLPPSDDLWNLAHALDMDYEDVLELAQVEDHPFFALAPTTRFWYQTFLKMLVSQTGFTTRTTGAMVCEDGSLNLSVSLGNKELRLRFPANSIGTRYIVYSVDPKSSCEAGLPPCFFRLVPQVNEQTLRDAVEWLAHYQYPAPTYSKGVYHNG